MTDKPTVGRIEFGPLGERKGQSSGRDPLDEILADTPFQMRYQRPAEQMVEKLEDEIRTALTRFLPGWTMGDVKRRCRIVRTPGIAYETLYCDDTPLLDIYPVEHEVEQKDDRTVIRFIRKIRVIAGNTLIPNGE